MPGNLSPILDTRVFSIDTLSVSKASRHGGISFRRSIRITRILFGVILGCAAFIFSAAEGRAATLSLSPATGSFQVGSTFDVSAFLDTSGESVNAIELYLSFPPDRLQLVTPSAGNSIIGVWTAQPKFNNTEGRVEFQGGIPSGITVSKGLVTTLTFRVKSIGTALVKILDTSRVLLNDGKGTDALSGTANGFYELALPPPAGPIVVSETHPVQSEWYQNAIAVFTWDADPGVQGYSYVLNEEPTDIVDDISEGMRSSVTYRALADGVHYFHVKALRDGKWGGTTHFAIRVDTAPPAAFPVEVLPATRTVRQQPLIQFQTTDAASGIDHYELKLVQLSRAPAQAADMPSDEPLFIEAQSPYIPSSLDLGDYDVIVRAYDHAKNYREVTQKLSIVTQIFQFVGNEGLSINNRFMLPWNAVWAIAAVLLALCGLLVWKVRRWHRQADARRSQKELPEELRRQLDELSHYRKKYGATLLLLLAFSVFLLGAASVAAQSVAPTSTQNLGIAPPIISTVSRSISNEEIFYVGGKTENPGTNVILYLQDLRSGETTSMKVVSDARNEWFYQHYTFLPVGSYLLWAQAMLGEGQSPPSPQVQFTVERTAFQIGASRVGFETLYLALIILLAAILLVLLCLSIYHGVAGRRVHAAFMKEMKEAEESVRRGFAVLRRDIQAELAVVKKAHFSRELSEEESRREEQLLRDLDWVERYIGKEVWDVEKAEQG